MAELIQLALSAFAAASNADTIRATTIRVVSAAFCIVFAGALMLAALGCAAAALWIVTLPSLGSIGAALVVAAALAIVALIPFTAAWFILRPRRRGRDAAPLQLPESLIADATRLFGDHKGAMLLATAVAGMAVANQGQRP